MSAPDEGVPAEGGDSTTEAPPPVTEASPSSEKPASPAGVPEEAPPGKSGSAEQAKRTSGGDSKRTSIGDAKKLSGAEGKRASVSDPKKSSLEPKGTSKVQKPDSPDAEGSSVEPKGEDGELRKSGPPLEPRLSEKLTPLTHPVGEIEELAGIPGSKAGGGGAAADTLATDLAGTLQTFFTQEETKPDANAFKPLRRPKLIQQNTYRMQAYNPFHPDRVQKVVDQALPELLANVKYNVDTASDVAAKISEKIRTRILALRFDRYKIIVLTSIGPVSRQGVHIAFRCLWDVDKDSYSFGSFKNSHIFCSVSVYGIYFE